MWGSWWSMWPYMSNVESGVNDVFGKTWHTPISTGCKKKSLIDRVSCRHVHVLFLGFVFFIIFNIKSGGAFSF